MNRKIILFGLSVLVIIGVVSFVNAQTNEIGTISGKVLPIDSNATVYVTYPNQKNFNLSIAGFSTINDKGEYTITVPMGIYDIIVLAKGDYINRSVLQIGVKEDEVNEIQDIILAKIGETGSISGYINPIVKGAIVQIKKFGANKYDGSDIVANDGSYEITGLEPETYGIFVRFNKTQNFYNYKWGMIDIVANVSLSGINLTFTPRNSKYYLDRITIKFQPEFSEKEKRNIIKSHNSTLMSHYDYSSSYSINIPSDKTVEEMVEIFQADLKVKSAYLSGISFTGGVKIVKIDEDILEEPESEVIKNDSIIQNFSMVEKEPESIVIKKQEKSLFGRLIDWLKSLFGLK